jgi:phosphate:Na+ symporter
LSGTMTLLQLGGYVGLLLWGTHMVGTGVERGFGAELRLWLGLTLSRPGGRARFYAFLAGLAVTAALQSSTATGLMATSFAASGAIGLAPALAMMLGANLGSTLITQVLAFNIAEVAPVLVLVGVVVFRSSHDGRGRNLGRVGIGLGLMLLALGGLVGTLEPVETAPTLRAVLGSLADEPVLAVLLAAALTWGCHSSVAVVLLIGSLAHGRYVRGHACSGRSKSSVRATGIARPSVVTSPTSATCSRLMTRTKARGPRRFCRRSIGGEHQ